jgi:transposase
MEYPLLQEMLALRGLTLKPTYTNREVAAIFGVGIRAIQARIQKGNLVARDLPGKARFLPADLEEYLNNSRRIR